MPTYEYICDSCEHEFEKFQSITAPAIKLCPECNRKKVRRKIGTGAGFLFKGGGFYETDYRSKNYTDAAKKDADAAKPASESKSETKPDTKSEGKSESKSETKSEAPSAPKRADKSTSTNSDAKPKKSKSD
jgi:putative FmdB family regulatory protein